MEIVQQNVKGPFGTNLLRATFDTKSAGVLRLVLSGAIDENSDLENVFARITGNAVINMRAVDRINSMGVHYWIPLVVRTSAHHRLVFEEISYAMVQNAVAVANMFGTAELSSCMAPYSCATCKGNFTVTVTRDEVIASSPEAPVKRCARCQTPMEFDELDGYFSFFKIRQAK